MRVWGKIGQGIGMRWGNIVESIIYEQIVKCLGFEVVSNILYIIQTMMLKCIIQFSKTAKLRPQGLNRQLQILRNSTAGSCYMDRKTLLSFSKISFYSPHIVFSGKNFLVTSSATWIAEFVTNRHNSSQNKHTSRFHHRHESHTLSFTINHFVYFKL